MIRNIKVVCDIILLLKLTVQTMMIFFCYFTGDNNQIVTIVPSSTNPGEVSYVLIVEQSGENDKDDTVYDFNEADEGLSYVSVMLLC